MADYTKTIQGTVSQNASDGSSNGWEFYMEVSYTQDATNNQTTFTVHQYLKSKYRRFASNYSYKNSIGSNNTGTKTVTNTTYYGSDSTSWVIVDIVPEYTVTVTHQSNGQVASGSDSITLSSYFLCDGSGYGPGKCNASVTLTIPQITRGLVYIDNGSSWDAYQVFIDNGSSWDQYIPYIDNGSSWDQCV